MSADSERQIIAAYQEQQIALRAAAQSTVEAAWNGLGSYNAADVQPFVDAIRPVVTAAQQQAASMTDGYIATLGAEVTGDPALYAALDPNDYVGAAVRNGTPFDEEYRRPFVQVWSDLAGGVQWTAAIIGGARRLGLLANTDVALSSRAAARDAMAADHRIVGYRRVLTGFRSCRFCAVASTQRYHVKDLMPLHASCDCAVAPLWGTEDPGWIINRDLLHKLQQDSDRQDYWNEHGFVDEHGNPVTSPKKIQAANRDVTVKEHGELGPTLVSDKHHFTGPDEIKAAKKHGVAGGHDAQKLSAGRGAGGSGGGTEPPSTGAGPMPEGDDAARLLDDAYQGAREAASDAQLAAARLYQDPDRSYERFNKALRGDETPDPEVGQAIDDLGDLVENGAVPTAIQVYRGVRDASATFGVPADELGSLVGQEIEAKGFLSTTVHRDVAVDEFTQPPLGGGPAILELEVSEGTKAAWMPKVGDPDMAPQGELLLGDSTHIRVREVTEHDGQTIIRGEVVA